MSQLRNNIVSLFALQGANYLLPLVTIPYLVRVLGPANYGRIAFAQAFVQYFVVLTDYGFNLSATRALAMVRGDREATSRLFCAVTAVKLALMVAGFAFMLVVVGLFPVRFQDWKLYILVYLAVVGSVLFPVWFFQGLERMRLMAVLSIISRLVTTVAIFILVRNRDDYHLAAVLQAGGLLLAGVASWILLPRLANIVVRLPTRRELKSTVVDGWHIFLSTAAISLYTTSNIFILGLLTSPVIVGYFSGADKLIKAVQGLVSPVTQAVYPHIAALRARSREAALGFVRRLLRVQGGMTLVMSLLLFALSGPIVRLVLGDQFQPAVRLVEWMALLPFVIGLSNIFGIQVMLIFDMKKTFSRILLGSGLLNIAMIIPLATWLGGEGAAISVLITEIAVTAAMALALVRQGLMAPILLASVA